MGFFGLRLYRSLATWRFMSLVGEESRMLVIPRVLTGLLLIVVMMIPVFFTIAIGFILRLDLLLIAAESVVVFLGPLLIFSFS